MSLETILLVVLIILVIGAFPSWGHSQSWGYAPSGILTLLLAVFLIWAIAGDRPLFRRAGHNLENVGHDLKDSGRELSEKIRRTVD